MIPTAEELKNDVSALVTEKVLKGEPFTSACISHAFIEKNGQIGHKYINEFIRELMEEGTICDSNGRWIRTAVRVYSDGPAGPDSTPVFAFLYHPANYDPNNFAKNSRRFPNNKKKSPKLASNKTDEVKGMTCKIQTQERRLSVPQKAVIMAGFKPDDPVSVKVVGHKIIVFKNNGASIIKVDKEGRIRLRGEYVKNFDSGVASVVDSIVDGQTIEILSETMLAPMDDSFTDSKYLDVDSGDDDIDTSVWSH